MNDPDVNPSELMRHAGWLRTLARALVRDDDDADDLAQETLIVALNRGPGPGNPLRPWLRGILRNTSRMHARTRNRRQGYELRAVRDWELPRQEAAMAESELRRSVADIVSLLAEPHRSTLLLHYVHGFSASEIARQEKLPASTVRARIAAGLRELRRELDTRFGDRRTWLGAFAPLLHPRWAPRWLPLPAAVVMRPRVSATVALVIAGVCVVAWLSRSPHPADSGPDRVRVLNDDGVRPPRLATGASGDEAPARSVAGLDGDEPAVMPAATDRAALVPTASAPSPCAPTARNHLLVTGLRLCELRASIARPGHPRQAFFERLRALVSLAPPDPLAARALNDLRADAALAAAFVHLMTGDGAYARAAHEHLRAIFTHAHRRPHDGSVLGRARTGVALALVYDWIADALDPEARRQLAARIDEALDAWPALDGHDRLAAPASSWAAAARSAELLLMLARDAERSRTARFQRAKNDLLRHLEQAYGDLGASSEGPFLTAYTGELMLPAIYALQERGDDDLARALGKIEFWKLALYATTPGRDPAGNVALLAWSMSPGEGDVAPWLELLGPTVPVSHRAVYSQLLRPHEPARMRSQTALMWGTLYRPEDGSARRPGDLLPTSVADVQQGLFFFRKGWDESDLQALLVGDFRASPPSGAPEIAEAFQLGLRAFGHTFISGPGGKGINGVSSLQVEGAGRISNRLVGQPVAYEPRAQGGYVVLDGGTKYQALGLREARRHLLVDLSGRVGTGLVVTLDRVRLATERRAIVYQLNVGNPRDDGGVTVSAAQERHVPTFTLRHRDRGVVKAWVLSTTAATVEPGDPLRVRAPGTDIDLMVVMVVSPGEPPPQPHVEGAGLATTLTFGTSRVRYEPRLDRVVLENVSHP